MVLWHHGTGGRAFLPALPSGDDCDSFSHVPIQGCWASAPLVWHWSQIRLKCVFLAAKFQESQSVIGASSLGSQYESRTSAATIGASICKALILSQNGQGNPDGLLRWYTLTI